MDESAKNLAYSEADGLLDCIELMFLTDLGEGHMETFNQDDNLDLSVDFHLGVTEERVVFTNKLTNLKCHNNKKTRSACYTDNIPIISRYFLSDIDFRGPPYLLSL